MTRETKPPSEPLDLTAMATAATAAYRGLVGRAARGEATAPDQLREVLTSAGKSVNTFKTDADRLRARCLAAAVLDATEAREAELVAAREQLTAAEAERTAFYKEFASRKIAIDNAAYAAGEYHAALESGIRHAKAAAEDFLTRSADPEIAAEVKLHQVDIRRAAQDALARNRRDPLHDLPAGSKGATVPAADRVALAESAKIVSAAKMQAAGARALDPIGGMAWAE